jgi:hypothetical protein
MIQKLARPHHRLRASGLGTKTGEVVRSLDGDTSVLSALAEFASRRRSCSTRCARPSPLTPSSRLGSLWRRFLPGAGERISLPTTGPTLRQSRNRAVLRELQHRRAMGSAISFIRPTTGRRGTTRSHSAGSPLSGDGNGIGWVEVSFTHTPPGTSQRRQSERHLARSQRIPTAPVLKRTDCCGPMSGTMLSRTDRRSPAAGGIQFVV